LIDAHDLANAVPPSVSYFGESFRKFLALLAALLGGFHGGSLFCPVSDLGLALLTQAHGGLARHDDAMSDGRKLALQPVKRAAPYHPSIQVVICRVALATCFSTVLMLRPWCSAMAL